MDKKRDYYEVLGVDRNADANAIKKAYRKLAKNIIPIPMPGILRLRKNLRKLQKLTMF